MTRAAVFIGVNKAGNLPTLQDAVRGAEHLHTQWAVQQKIGPAELVTDKNGPVTPNSISDAIQKILDDEHGLTQLCIYFAGHGVNVRMGEYWLLTDSHRSAQAAVNVRGSEDLARYCGVPHVVFISDACRTAADTIDLQNVTGSEIFPIKLASDQQRSVDLFYACAIGRPAHEARDVRVTSSEFKAIYTAALNDALCFQVPSIIDYVIDGNKRIGYIRPRRLRDSLPGLVATRIRTLKLQKRLIQVPDARITSDPDAWLSRWEDPVEPAGPPVPSNTPLVGEAFPQEPRHSEIAAAPSLGEERTPDILGGLLNVPNSRTLDSSLVTLAIRDPMLVSNAVGTVQTAGPQRFETECGFKIRGARFAAGFSLGVWIERLGPSREIVRAGGAELPSASILLVLDDGSGIVLPPIPQFIASLTVEDGELIDVSYEPSDNSVRWGAYAAHAKELRTLRRVISSATRSGAFRLEGDEAPTLAHRMQYAKSVDPSLAVYAAYGYNDLQRIDLIRDMYHYMAGDLGAPLFDVAMLAHMLDRKKTDQRPPLRGFAPLLSQGWAYLRSRGIPLPEGLDELPAMIRESVWTMYSAKGVDRLRNTLFKGAKPWQIV